MLNDKLAQFAVEDDLELDQVVGGAGAGRHGRIMGKPKQINGETWYTVAAGDTAKAVAAYFETTVDQLMHLNVGRLVSAEMLFPDMNIRVI